MNSSTSTLCIDFLSHGILASDEYKTSFATVGFLPTFRVGDKLRFLGRPGVLFGCFPAKSKPEAQVFVN